MRKCLSLIVACLAAFAASTYASDSRVDNIVDPYGNMFLQFVAPSATAVNNCVLQNAATANNPQLKVVGSDANITLDLKAKGTGLVRLLDGNGNVAFQTAAGVASAVDNMSLVNSAAIVGPSSITNVARSTTTVTITTAANHGLSVGQYVLVNAVTNSGTAPNSINGMYKVATVPTATTFTYTDINSGTIASGADTGTVTPCNAFGPQATVAGSDSNINMNILPVGTGIVQAQLGGGTTVGALLVTANAQTYTSTHGCSAGATDDPLLVYTLPANTLKNVGDYVRVVAYGKAAGGTHNCVTKIFFGSDTVVTSGTVSDTSAFAIRQAITVIKTGASTQLELTDDNYFGTTANIARAVPTAGSQTDTSDITIKFTGNCGTADEIIGNVMLVEFGRMPQ